MALFQLIIIRLVFIKDKIKKKPLICNIARSIIFQFMNITLMVEILLQQKMIIV